MFKFKRLDVSAAWIRYLPCYASDVDEKQRHCAAFKPLSYPYTLAQKSCSSDIRSMALYADLIQAHVVQRRLLYTASTVRGTPTSNLP